eukprot:gene11804-15742_t
MVEKVPMTAGGYAALEVELKERQTVNRPRIIEQIAEARSHGDLSENAEYHAAKERQGQVEAAISEIEDKIGRAQIIDPTTLSGDKIVFVEGELALVGAPVGEDFLGIEVLDLRKTERSETRGENGIEEGRGSAVGGVAAVGVGGGPGAVVAARLAEIEAGAERDGDLPQEIAPTVPTGFPASVPVIPTSVLDRRLHD